MDGKLISDSVGCLTVLRYWDFFSGMNSSCLVSSLWISVQMVEWRSDYFLGRNFTLVLAQ